MSNTNKKPLTHIDHLDEDDPIPRQNWVCISFLSPEGIKNCSTRGLKIRGVYETHEEAKKRAHELQTNDPYFHVFVGEMGKWLSWDPDVNSVEDQVYIEDQLNDLMKGYKENIKKAKKVNEQRKHDMVDASKEGNQNSKNNEDKLQNLKSRMREKLEKRKQQTVETCEKKEVDPVDKIVEKEIIVETEEKKASEMQNELKQTETLLKEKQENINTIDEKIKKIKSLYEKINKK